MENKNVVIWGNCQGGPIYHMLKKFYSNIFIYQNYVFIRDKIELPIEILNADIFIYQNYADKPNSIYDLKYILSTLKLTCKIISIPFLQCDFYFPYNNAQHENNKNTISEKFPHGEFFYGIEPIHKLINNSILYNDAIKIIKTDDFIKDEDIENYYNRSLDFMNMKILTSDVPELKEFILNNFRKTRLFYNRNHPSYLLIRELLKGIFKLLDLPYEETESDTKLLKSALKDWIVPILPSVVKFHKLEFNTDECFSVFDDEIVSIDDYLLKYLKHIGLNDNFDFNNIEMASDIVMKDYNKFKSVKNLKYIHFYEGDLVGINQLNHHFILVDDKTYYADFYSIPHLVSVIRDKNSKAISQIKNNLKNLDFKELNLNKAIILYINTRSAGHELANIIHTIYLYHINNLNDYDIVVSDKIKDFGIFMESILYLFFDKSKIHFVDNKTVVNIKNSYINYPPTHKIDKSISFFLDKLSYHRSFDIIYDKLCMIKANVKSNVATGNRAFSIDYIDFFTKYGFNCINAEDFDVIKLYNIIRNSKHVILSWGCNSWINGIFVDTNQEVMILCHIGYKHEYDDLTCKDGTKETLCTPKCKKIILVNDLIYDIDTIKLTSKIEEFGL